MLGRSFGDREALRRFEREAQASARLTHPHIVTVFDFGGAGAAGAFIVMELVRGRTIRAMLDQQGRLAPADAARWFAQMCAAVAAAHAERIVHRDLKPENVIVDGAGVKVLDFGLAKFADAAATDSAGLTQTGVVVGTPGYMAPEQLSGGTIDERTDVFAIGVMAVEAVTGRRPFRGRTQTDLLAAMANEPVTLGGEDAAFRRLEAVLQRAVATKPSALRVGRRAVGGADSGAARSAARRDRAKWRRAGDHSRLTTRRQEKRSRFLWPEPAVFTEWTAAFARSATGRARAAVRARRSRTRRSTRSCAS
jgi:serine/threonine-protein kinase